MNEDMEHELKGNKIKLTKKNEKKKKKVKDKVLLKKRNHNGPVDFSNDELLGSKRFLKNGVDKSNNRKHIKKKSRIKCFHDTDIRKKTSKIMNINEEQFLQRESDESKNSNGGYEHPNEYSQSIETNSKNIEINSKNIETNSKGTETNSKSIETNSKSIETNNRSSIYADNENNLTTSNKLTLNDQKEEDTQLLNETIYPVDMNNELQDNIYFNSDEDENVDTEEQNYSNIESGPKQIDYITYIEGLRKKKQNEENIKVKVEKSYDVNDHESEVEKEIGKEKIYKIFLLFAPLAITSFNFKNYLVNADDHLEMFENKKKKLEELLTNEKNPRKKYELEEQIEKIKNNLKNSRSDIVFFTLLALRDSVLNKQNKLQIYIHTINNLLIYVSPQFRVPRNFFLFKKVMTALLTRGVVYDNERNVLLQVLPDPMQHYIQDSICVGVSNYGFPADAKKFTDKVKQSNEDYSFFFSLSNMYDVTDIIEKDVNRNQSKWDKHHNQERLCVHNTTDCFYNYYIRISDLQLSPVIACSKLTYFLN